jgi:hypothetical protein
MDSYPVRYRFSQIFDVPSKFAYQWCIDYKPYDWKIMGKNGKRKIRRFNEDTLILTDTVVTGVGPVTKQRLVRLNGDRLAWTNTHISGPNKHSQFWYQIVSLGRDRSRLDFIGLQVNYGKRPSASKIAATARGLQKDDSGMWVLLAKEMSKDHLDRSRKD